MKTVTKVLIIDDDRIDAMSIKRSLLQSENNLQVSCAETAHEGISLLQQDDFKCVFCDFNLPDLDGLSLIKLIRENGFYIPVVIVTSYGDEKIAAEAIRAGACDYIPKSLISPDGLSMSLRNALKHYENDLHKKDIEKALQLSEARLKEAQKLAHFGSFEISFNSRDFIMSEEAMKITGLKASEANFFNMMRKILPDDFNMVKEVIDNVISSRKSESIDFRIKTNRGQKYLNARFYVDKDTKGNPIRLLATLQDISERKLIESELRKAKEVAEESLKMRERFLANISHEIRTPMNGIIGLTNLLLEMVSDNEQIEYLKAIRSSGDNLLVIINDLLDLSKIQSGKIKFEKLTFELKDHLDTTLRMLRIKAEEKNINLEFEYNEQIPERISGDKYRLNQIIVNLIGNAIKFTDKGDVKLHVDLIQETKDKVYIQFDITDSGIGIAKDKLDYVFESFTQANLDTERKYGGTGLGLSICKQLVELQGGKIWVNSELGIGSTFSFTIAYNKVITNNQTKDKMTLDDLKKVDWSNRKVLLVEDNKVNLLLATKVLSNWGLQVDVAENGKIATEKAVLQRYDVILMDLQMPVMDGYEATRIIREEFKMNIPIIVMTASAMREELEKCMFQGMNDYITKPFQPDELQRLLQHWFNKPIAC